jgi:hypothetical protein
MSATNLQSPVTGMRSIIRQAWQFNRLLTFSVIAFVLLIPLPFIGMALDPKVITGVNGWIKPLKFLLSAAIYSATFLWLLTYVKGRRRWVQFVANVTAVVLLIEIALIVLQVIRGASSHFNVATGFDAAVYSIMGTAITILAVMNLVLAILLLIQRMDDRGFAWSLRLGVLASFVGITVAFFMTAGPTPEQLAAMEAGAPMTTIGAHSVGVADGGPGLPFVGWSTAGGDLRVPHFVGLHGMQVIPLLGWWLSRPAQRRRYREGQRLAFVWIGGLSYIGFTLLLTWQALRGQSVIAPDGPTLAGFGILVGAAFVAALAVGLMPARGDVDGELVRPASPPIVQ